MMAKKWMINCPDCDHPFEVAPAHVRIECGRALADCTCPNCDHEFQADQDYLTWLGVEGGFEGGLARSRTPN